MVALSFKGNKMHWDYEQIMQLAESYLLIWNYMHEILMVY